MNVMTNCSYFRSGYLCLPRFVGAGPHRHLQRHPNHVAALLLLSCLSVNLLPGENLSRPA